jgi:hypothetical protein
MSRIGKLLCRGQSFRVFYLDSTDCNPVIFGLLNRANTPLDCSESRTKMTENKNVRCH